MHGTLINKYILKQESTAMLAALFCSSHLLALSVEIIQTYKYFGTVFGDRLKFTENTDVTVA